MQEDSCENRRVAGGRAVMTSRVFFSCASLFISMLKYRELGSGGWGSFTSSWRKVEFLILHRRPLTVKYIGTHPSIDKIKKVRTSEESVRKLSLQQEFNQQASILVGCVTPAFWVRGELGRCMVPGGGMVPGWRVWCRGGGGHPPCEQIDRLV